MNDSDIKLLRLEKPEIISVWLCLLLSFFFGINQIVLATSANALFLQNYPASYLPYVYIAGAIVLPIIGLFFLSIYRRFTFYISTTAQLFLLLLVPALLSIVYSLDPMAEWPSFVLAIWVDADIVLSGLVFWSIANRIFNLRQAKRVFGIIAVGQVAGVIMAGAILPSVIQIVSVRLLIPVACSFYLITLGLFVWLFRLLPENMEPLDKIEKQTNIVVFLKNRYLLLIFLMVGIGYIIYYFVDNAFYQLSQEYWTEPRRLAIFLARFWSVVGLVTFLMKTFVFSRWTAIAGIGGGLLISAALLLLLLLAFSGSFLFPFTVVPLFWFVVAMKFTERVFVSSFYVPSYFALFQALPVKDRDRAQNLSETVVGQTAGAVAGLGLFVVYALLPFRSIGFYLSLCVLCLVWMGVSVIVFKEYRHTIKRTLSRFSWREKQDVFADPLSIQTLLSGCESKNPLQVAFCINQLLANNYEELDGILLNHISDSSALVRRQACSLLPVSAFANGTQTIIELLESEQDFDNVKVLLLALVKTPSESVRELLETYNSHSNESFRIMAAYLQLRYFEGKSRDDLFTLMSQAILNDSQPGRNFAAKIIRDIPGDESLLLIRLLLERGDTESKKIALDGQVTLLNDDLHGYLLDNLDDQALSAVAVKIIMRGGADFYPALAAKYHSHSVSESARLSIIKIFGRQKNEKALVEILKMLPERNKNLRLEIYRALYLHNYQLVGSDQLKFDELFEDEISYASLLSGVCSEMSEAADEYLLISALSNELAKVRERLFLLLALKYTPEDIIDIWTNYLSSSNVRNALAIEYLEGSIAKAHFKKMLPVLTNGRLRETAAILKRWYPYEPSNVLEHLAGIVSQEHHWFSSWVVECARCETGTIPPGSPIPELIRKIKLLKQSQLFADVYDDILASIASVAEEQIVSEGERIITKGELGSSMYIIADGMVKVHDGDTYFDSLGTGNYFGELAALSPEARTASITALTETRLYCLNREWTFRFIEDSVQVSGKIISTLCERIRNTIERRLQDGGNPPKKIRKISAARKSYKKNLSLLQKIILYKGVELFKSLPVWIVSDMAQSCEPYLVQMNRRVFTEGELSAEFYIVYEGEIKIHRGDRTISFHKPGDFFGEISAFDLHPREADATAAVDTILLAISSRAIHTALWDRNAMVQSCILYLIERLRFFQKI